MPELPEVETTKRGIEKAIIGNEISGVWTSGKNLRYPISPKLAAVTGLSVVDVSRRAKYLLIALNDGSHLLYHLGMSGMMRLRDSGYKPEKHDHVIIRFSAAPELVFHDPRRFGCVVKVDDEINQHPLIKRLGPEPFDEVFTPAYLKRLSKNKTTPVKTFIMNNDVVVGVGNIYASEALFQAGIHPHRKAGNISLKRFGKLHEAVIGVLTDAINAGGTTLKDFHQSDGKPGYFQQKLMVYGRHEQKCFNCNSLIKKVITGQRSTFYCPHCQR
ncbi:bifunctional DNA-formamidopyrimidine glycosylase/DNA-(apurinic or apyrimidinic site) lyase [Marinicella rhabdoformis]|uniref:bifunctional DNA-formamidopyrimidine glycosylase/DNA-(apurinic or apyrimidinic site) lyase n=1 Tax=Marinicella rhabdoformis TaxID=2580566 RepID=UPI0012AECEB5|nr:bifunctional DNA-formamidopyrimidine glycosylase/DNA-(apurinic or apyrimidinic site) lyase [Marinicella rhabdoformis]